MKFAAILLLAAMALSGNVEAVKQEQNLERRSDLALNYADDKLDAAKELYEKGQSAAFVASLTEMIELVDLSYKSLQDSGKRARRSPKYFKRAETKIRALVRRLDTLEIEMSTEDRPPVADAKKHLRDVNDQIVHDIMSKK